MNYSFEKRWTDAEHVGFEIWYIDLVTGVSTKRVDADKPLYLAWLAAGNTPTEIEFVPPPTPEPVPDWDGFEEWAETNMLGKFLTVPGIIPAWVLNELTTHDIDGLRRAIGTAVQASLVSFSDEEKSAINTAATDRNIGAVFS